jgi:hypothetical protein
MKSELNNLSQFDKLRLCLKESLESHKPYRSEYWRGSRAMIESVLDTMNQLEKL